MRGNLKTKRSFKNVAFVKRYFISNKKVKSVKLNEICQFNFFQIFRKQDFIDIFFLIIIDSTVPKVAMENSDSVY